MISGVELGKDGQKCFDGKSVINFDEPFVTHEHERIAEEMLKLAQVCRVGMRVSILVTSFLFFLSQCLLFYALHRYFGIHSNLVNQYSQVCCPDIAYGIT